MADLVASDYLCFLSSQYDKVDKESLFSVICEFYEFDESVTAKQLLINECDKLGLSDSINEFKKRRQNAKGDGNKKVARDILDIWSVIDCQKAGKMVSTFVAVDLNRIPPVNAKN